MMELTAMQLLQMVLFMTLLSSVFGDPNTPLKGTFWHITDIHVDANYSRSGNPHDLCHESVKYNATEDNGIYGNFLCDSPQTLLDLSIAAMVKINSKPDFIIWTGDNLPHTRNPNPEWDVVLGQIKNITKQLRNAFKDVVIYPSIGNHDTYPPNMLSPANYSTIYEDYFEKGGWKDILPQSTWATFKRGGYYSHSLNSGLRVISLNTILWYQSNAYVQNETDPFQFEFVERELKAAQEAQQKVYIIGHVSPGFYNRIRSNTPSTPLYHLPYLKVYLNIVRNHADVIAGQFFGHIHNDMFQLYYCDTGTAYSSGLLASSVTPWYSDTPKNVNVSVPVNPSLRLLYYSRTTKLLLDYEQYFLNLTKANQESQKTPAYELLYTFTDAYGVQNLSTSSLSHVYEHLKANETLFQLFFKYLTAGEQTVGCDNVCKTAQLCSMGSTSKNEYSSCIRAITGDDVPNDNKSYPSMPYIIGFVSVLIVAVMIGLFVYCKRNRRHFRNTRANNSYYGF